MASVQNDLNELEGLMDSWMTRSPAKGQQADNGAAAGVFVPGLAPAPVLHGGSYKSPRSHKYFSDNVGGAAAAAPRSNYTSPQKPGVDRQEENEFASYVVSKVSGRPVQLPPVRQMMASGKTRKVYGYQEPSKLMQKNHMQRKEQEWGNLHSSGGKFQREVDQHRGGGKNSGWVEGPSGGIPGLSQLPPSKARRNTAGRTGTTSHRNPTQQGRYTAPVGGRGPSRLPPLNPSDIRQPRVVVSRSPQRNPAGAHPQGGSKQPVAVGSRGRVGGVAALPKTNNYANKNAGLDLMVTPSRGVKLGVGLDPKVELERCLWDKAQLLEKAAAERSQRSNLTRRSTQLQQSIDDAKGDTGDCQSEAKRLDQVVKRLQSKAAAAVKQATSLRQKEKQLKELKAMHRVAVRRLDGMLAEEMKADAPLVSLSTEATDHGDAEEDRKSNKQQEQMREQNRELNQQRNDLLSEVNRLEAKDKERNRSTNDMVGKMEREKHLARLEIERKASGELQKEISRIRDNFEKVQRHRQREIKNKSGEMTAEASQLQSKVLSLQQTGSTHSKDLATMSIKVAGSRAQLDETKTKIQEMERKIETTLANSEKFRQRVATAVKEQRTASKELELLRAQPSNTVAPMELEASKERKQLNEEASLVASKQKQLLAEIGHAEDELETAKSELQNAEQQQQGAGGLSQGAKKDTEDLEQQISNMKSEIKKIKLDTKNLLEKFESESKAKDSVIEGKTRAIGQHKTSFKSLNSENTKLLEQLDALERMASMNGVST